MITFRIQVLGVPRSTNSKMTAPMVRSTKTTYSLNCNKAVASYYVFLRVRLLFDNLQATK